MSATDPHADQPVLHAGPDPHDAAATVVMVHGRGATAQSILQLHQAFNIDTLAAIAPQAAGHTWYPHSFLSPLGMNQPYLDSALGKIESMVLELINIGVPSDRIALLGFSQGACLISEFVARHPRRYGAVMILTGGVIGPDGTPRNYEGDLAGTPIFIGANDPDPHVPFARVRDTESVFSRLGGTVEVRRYPGLPHSINEDELQVCRAMLLNTVKFEKEIHGNNDLHDRGK